MVPKGALKGGSWQSRSEEPGSSLGRSTLQLCSLDTPFLSSASSGKRSHDLRTQLTQVAVFGTVARALWEPTTARPSSPPRVPVLARVPEVGAAPWLRGAGVLGGPSPHLQE